MDGVPDGELGVTGRGPRTELTHQVPGRRPRSAPVIVEPSGRLAVLRDAVRSIRPGARRAVVLGLVVAGLMVAGLTMAGWVAVRATGTPAAGAAAVAAASSALPAIPAVAAVEEPADPATADEWRVVVDGLYRRRAEAFATASPEVLGEVYPAGSALLTADVELARSLAAAGEVLRGFAPVVEQVTVVEQDADRVQLDLIDSWAGYEVVPAGRPDAPAVGAGPARAAAGVRMVLVRAGDSWLIESAERRT
jgi:hypothetical protein